jgi:hypothetical protein
VLAGVGRGLSNEEIAAEIHISPATARTYVSRILTKLGARDRAQLVVIAYETGLVNPAGIRSHPTDPESAYVEKRSHVSPAASRERAARFLPWCESLIKRPRKEHLMSARISRRTLLAGLAAMPALTVVGCEFDRTTAAPISTVDTLDFSNLLRIPALAESTVDHDGVRVFPPQCRRGIGRFLPGVSTPTWGYTDGRYKRRISRGPRCGRPAASRFG